jgi:hypothetical protein
MGFFKGLKSFFFDFAAPIGLSIINPALGAAYSGIKTGIQTGSPLAGLGSAGLSLAMSSAFKGVGQAMKGPITPITETVADTAAKAGTTGFMAAGQGIKYGASSIANQASNLATSVGTGVSNLASNIGIRRRSVCR